MARPSHQPTERTRQQVEMLISFGLTHDAIAAIIGVHDDTLRKHYAQELDHGRAKVVAQVANSLVKKALSDRSDSVSAAKFYLQSQGGWQERSEQTVTEVIRTVSAEPISSDEWQEQHDPSAMN